MVWKVYFPFWTHKVYFYFTEVTRQFRFSQNGAIDEFKARWRRVVNLVDQKVDGEETLEREAF